MRYAVWSMCGYNENFLFCHPLSHAVPKDHQNCGWETNTFPSAITPFHAPCIWTQFRISCLFGKRTHPLHCLRMYIHMISVWQETMWENERYHLSVWLPVSIKVEMGIWHIPIWKRLITIFKRGMKRYCYPFPYRNPGMETGIDASPFPYGECPVTNPFPYGVHDHLGIEGKHPQMIIHFHLNSLFPYRYPHDTETGRQTK